MSRLLLYCLALIDPSSSLVYNYKGTIRTRQVVGEVVLYLSLSDVG